MELKDFIQLFADQFDETAVDLFTPETNFKELDEWSSLVALSVISMIDEELDKQVTGADLRKVATIKELFDLVNSK